jgi:hypothetical protein
MEREVGYWIAAVQQIRSLVAQDRGHHDLALRRIERSDVFLIARIEPGKFLVLARRHPREVWR